MKKIILILSITALSCSKDETIKTTHCYRCTIETRSAHLNQTDYYEMCDWTPEDARKAEEQGTSTTHFNGNTITQKTTCRLR